MRTVSTIAVFWLMTTGVIRAQVGSLDLGKLDEGMDIGTFNSVITNHFSSIDTLPGIIKIITYKDIIIGGVSGELFTQHEHNNTISYLSWKAKIDTLVIGWRESPKSFNAAVDYLRKFFHKDFDRKVITVHHFRKGTTFDSSYVTYFGKSGPSIICDLFLKKLFIHFSSTLSDQFVPDVDSSWFHLDLSVTPTTFLITHSKDSQSIADIGRHYPKKYTMNIDWYPFFGVEGFLSIFIDSTKNKISRCSWFSGPVKKTTYYNSLLILDQLTAFYGTPTKRVDLESRFYDAIWDIDNKKIKYRFNDDDQSITLVQELKED